MIDAVKVTAALLILGLTAALFVSRMRLRQTRRRLDRTKSELVLVGHSVPQILWKSAPDGAAEFVNNRFSEMTGIPAGQLDTATIQQAFHPDDVEPFFQEWARVLATGEDLRAYHRLLMADGSYHWMHVMGRPELDDEGKIVGWYGGTSDVDVEFRAQELIRERSLRLERLVVQRDIELDRTRWQYRTLFEDENLGVMELDFSRAKFVLAALRDKGTTDLDAYFDADPEALNALIASVFMTDVNAAFARMFGFDDGGQFLRERKPEGNLLCSRETLLRLFQGSFASDSGGFSIAAQIAKIDTSRLVVACSVHFSDGLATITAVDITDREQAHDMMLAAQAELARANRAGSMSAFSVSVAHEVHQPLTSMTIDIETSRRLMRRDELDREKLQQMFERIRRNATRVAEIVTSIRERVSNRRRDDKSVKVCLMIEESKALLDREAAAMHATLTTHCTVGLQPVRADPVELQQVLVNLITNALDAISEMPEDRRTIDLHLDPDGPDRIRVRVADSGTGISPDDMKRIFDPFFTTKAHGIGIGLQICRSIVESLGGELRAHNRPEGGAIFEFSLETVPPAPAALVEG